MISPFQQISAWQSLPATPSANGQPGSNSAQVQGANKFSGNQPDSQQLPQQTGRPAGKAGRPPRPPGGPPKGGGSDTTSSTQSQIQALIAQLPTSLQSEYTGAMNALTSSEKGATLETDLALLAARISATLDQVQNQSGNTGLQQGGRGIQSNNPTIGSAGAATGQASPKSGAAGSAYGANSRAGSYLGNPQGNAAVGLRLNMLG